MLNKARSIVGSGVVVAALFVTGLGNANAIAIRGNADPVFGGSGILATLYWTAEIAFDVQAACIAGTGTNTCAVTGLTVTGTLAASQNAAPTVNFDFLANPGPGSTPVVTLSHVNGIVTGIGTVPIGPTSFNYSANVFGFAWVDWNLPVNGGSSTAQLFLQNCATFNLLSFLDCHDETCTPSLGGAAGSTLTNITITQVPEPGVALLLLAALPALRLAYRRRAVRQNGRG